MAEKARFDEKKFLQALQDNWIGTKQCPVCAETNWTVTPDPVQLMRFSGGGLVLGAPVIPIVAVTCTNCGYTRLFNPLVMGAMEPIESE
jgi:predicted nucleic-acid-binding Zn-ribbon protein